MSLKRTKKEAKRKLVGKVGELTPGMTKKFTLSNGKYSVEGMLLNYQGSLYAYRTGAPTLVSRWIGWITSFLLSMAGT